MATTVIAYLLRLLMLLSIPIHFINEKNLRHIVTVWQKT